MEARVVCGREFSESVLERIAEAVVERPELTRTELSREVCRWMNWRQPNGQLCEGSCRVALGKLERQGLVDLPASRRAEGSSKAQVEAPRSVELETEIPGGLKELGAIELVRVEGSRSAEAKLWKEMIGTYHYCGDRRMVGAQMRYLIRCKKGWLGALGFSAAARHLRDRDSWIGWSEKARAAHLQEVVAHSRFLLLPWVKVPHLASKVLSLVARRVAEDWQAVYGYRPVLLETYVEEARFSGTCYRAANWQCIGRTSGRGRQDRDRTGQVPVKAIYVYALEAGYKRQLCREPLRRHQPLPAGSEEDSDWAAHEFAGARVKDPRLLRRLVTMAQDFYAHPQANLPQACGTQAKTKAAYRLLDHDQISLEQLLFGHFVSTVERMSKHAVVLAVQDTTSLNYSSHLATEGLGRIDTQKNGAQGLWLHDTMAFTPEGLPLGLLDAQVWARSQESFGKKAQRARLPIEQKESLKWLTSFTAAAAAQRELAQTQVVSVGDREADVYELFELALRRADHPHLLVRAQQDRRVAGGHKRLWETVEAQPVAGYQRVQASRHQGHSARVAHVAVRFAEVELCPPKNRSSNHKPLRVWAILGREDDPPPDVEPLEWTLLTTLPVQNGEEASEKLRWYAQRWQIEVYHRTLKSGCRIEQRQLATVARLENCLAIDMVVAWRIFYLTRLGREVPDLPCTTLFDDVEWQALHGFIHSTPEPPAEPPTLRQAIRMVATLGGFLGRKGDGEPGPQSLWLGLQRLDDIAATWRIFSSRARPP